MSVAVRFAFRRFDDAELGSLAMSSVALALTAAIALVAARGADLVDAWPFLVAGAIAPGASQIFFVRAVRDAGAARTSVVMGTAPLVAVAIAVTVLREPVSAALLAGGALIVAGGVALANERVRPADFRRLGIVLAVTATVLFAVRDNVLRAIAKGSDVDPLTAAAVSLLAGAATVAVYLAVTRRGSLGARLRPRCRRLRDRGSLLRALLRDALRGLLPRPRQRRRAAGGDRVALGRRVLGAVPAPQRAGRPQARARRDADRGGGRAHRGQCPFRRRTPASGPRSRGARNHARPYQGNQPWLRAIVAPGLVLTTRRPGSIT